MSANMKPLETAKNRRQASNCVDNIQSTVIFSIASH
jgi:hypothetical protein